MDISKLINTAKFHLVDSTAMLASSSPIFCMFETMKAKMSNDVSLNTRLYIAGLTYGGLGWIMGKGRDMSRKICGITHETGEMWRLVHDSMYIALANIPLSYTLYTLAGETDAHKIAVGTALSVGFGAVMGPFIGYSIDVYRDLTGLCKCERKTFPGRIKRLGPGVKKALAASLTAASILSIALIYSANSKRSAEIEGNSFSNPAIIEKMLPRQSLDDMIREPEVLD